MIDCIFIKTNKKKYSTNKGGFMCAIYTDNPISDMI